MTTKEKPLAVAGADRKLVRDAARLSGLSERQFLKQAIKEAALNVRVTPDVKPKVQKEPAHTETGLTTAGVLAAISELGGKCDLEALVEKMRPAMVADDKLIAWAKKTSGGRDHDVRAGARQPRREDRPRHHDRVHAAEGPGRGVRAAGVGGQQCRWAMIWASGAPW